MKVTVIEVDLGIDIDEIVNEGVAELTGKAQAELDSAIERQRTIQETKQKRKKQKDIVTNAITSVMDTAYSKLVDAGESGVPTEEILDLVTPAIANASAFTLRMKKILRDKGNPYVIKRKQRNKTPHYIFEPFNKQGDE